MYNFRALFTVLLIFLSVAVEACNLNRFISCISKTVQCAQVEEQNILPKKNFSLQNDMAIREFQISKTKSFGGAVKNVIIIMASLDAKIFHSC